MIDILIPVLGRPARAQITADSIHQNTSNEHRVVFIASPDDASEIAACERTGADVLIVPWPPGRGDWARKLNYAFDRTEGEWIFQGADDLRFSHHWDRQALLIADRQRKRVIGTADLGNPLVGQAKHSTHTLIKRSYIDDFGGTIDNTGRVFSELYDHAWGDNEFVETAMLRGEWAFAKRAVVEHLHPDWGKANPDPTYAKGRRRFLDDRRLYLRRMRKVRMVMARSAVMAARRERRRAQ